MRRFATGMEWIARGLLAAALALAPVAPAFAGCSPSKTQSAATASSTMDMSASTSKSPKPCDEPCSGCASDMQKKSCAGGCACVPFFVALSPIASFERISALQLEPATFAAIAGLARPPDTPPPKFLA
jgi:hypothetical protein